MVSQQSVSRPVQQDLLQAHPLLEIKQSQVVGVGAHLRHDLEGEGEAVADRHSLQAS